MAVAGQQLDANRQGIAPGHQPIAIVLMDSSKFLQKYDLRTFEI